MTDDFPWTKSPRMTSRSARSRRRARRGAAASPRSSRTAPARPRRERPRPCRDEGRRRTGSARRAAPDRALGQQRQRAARNRLLRGHASAAALSSPTMRSMRAVSVSLVSFSRKRSTISGKASGVARLSGLRSSRRRRHRLQSRPQPPHVEFILQHLPFGLAQKAVVGVVLAKDVVEQIPTRPASSARSSARPDSRRRRVRQYGRCRGSGAARVRRR